jgi:hypothetical protein
VVSPFSRGGWYCSDTFDHTSLLQFIETRFGVEVPNLSAWRRAATGDLTTALPHLARRHLGRRTGRDQRSGRHRGRGRAIPTADGQLHAHPGDVPHPSAGAEIAGVPTQSWASAGSCLHSLASERTCRRSSPHGGRKRVIGSRLPMAESSLSVMLDFSEARGYRTELTHCWHVCLCNGCRLQ